jgi:hypothetical protein
MDTELGCDCWTDGNNASIGRARGDDELLVDANEGGRGDTAAALKWLDQQQLSRRKLNSKWHTQCSVS